MKRFSRECLFPSKAAPRAAVFLTLLIVPESKKKSDSQILLSCKATWSPEKWIYRSSISPVCISGMPENLHSFIPSAAVPVTELSPRWMLETEWVLRSLARERPPLDIKAELPRVKSDWLSLGWAAFALVPGTKWNKLPMSQALC